MKKIFLAMALFSACLSINAQEEPIDVTARCLKNAPRSIFVHPTPGKPQLSNFLSKMVNFSDWFVVSKTAKGADYQIQISRISQTAITLSGLTSANKRFSVSSTVTKPNQARLIKRGVDALIKKFCNSPGFLDSQIAFVSNKTGHKEIYTASFERLSKATQLTHNKSISVEPEWSPSNRKLLYTLTSNNKTRILEVDLAKKSQKLFSASKGLNSNPAYSSNGSKVAMILSKDGKVELYSKTVGTNNLKRLTNNVFEESSPTWSIRNDLCFVANRTGRAQLYIANASTGKMSPLINSYQECVSPDWSTVSNKICFVIRMGSNYHIAVKDMSAPTTPHVVITKTAGDWEAPSWAPDGRHIICSRKLRGKSLLYMIDAITGKERALQSPSTKGNSYLPSWSTLNR